VRQAAASPLVGVLNGRPGLPAVRAGQGYPGWHKLTMKLLLTGFEPFGGSAVNPSEQAVRALAHEKLPRIQLRTAILPVDRVRGPAALIRAMKKYRPAAVLCLGEASSRMAISIERVAVNLMDYRIADNSGRQVHDEPIVPDGPAAYFVTLPVRAMLEAAQAVNVPAELSLSAGAFLCNQVLYAALHHIEANQLEARAGFVHLPQLPRQVAIQDRLIPSMSLDTILAGIRAILVAIARK
jgi:pyroglutamyl-peptidase